MASSNANPIDYELCDADDLKENEMKDLAVKVDDKEYKILLTKYQNQFYAVGNKCSHYSLPLSSGVVYNGRIRCFAHGACFDVKTGDIEDFPGVDCLPSYKVYLKGNKVHLSTTLEELTQKHRIKKQQTAAQSRPGSSLLGSLKSIGEAIKRPMSSATGPNAAASTKKYVIIGSGAAALECVETLRTEGCTNGSVTMITAESHTPYDRPKLSKSFDVDISAIAFRDENFYKLNNINFVKNQKVKKVHVDKRLVECESGNLVHYDKLVIATGLTPTPHKAVPGADLDGIFTLRSYDDSKTILSYMNQVKARKSEPLNVLIIGTSFVALESATYFTGKANVTIICRRLPFSSHFGKQAAEKVVQLHESKGVKFLTDSKLEVVKFLPIEEGSKQLKSAVMTDGSTLEADICLVAIGSRPATSFIKDSNITVNAAGYIIVDANMKTNVEDVYAAGDVVVFPRTCIKVSNDENKNDLINVPHWQMSHMLGRVAAYALLERQQELNSIPFFWTANHGKTVRFAGFNDKYDEIIFHEDPEKKNSNKFAAFYVLKNRVIAVASCDYDPLCAAVAELMYNNVVVEKQHIISDPWGVRALMI